MFGWISKSALPDEDTISWLFDVCGWLLEHTGGFEAFSKGALILPTPEFFPVDGSLEGQALAEQLFAATRHHAGMDEWPCHLVAHKDAPSTSQLLGRVPHSGGREHGAAGTFKVDRGQVPEITYSEEALAHPEAFVATMAHELSHYLMATIPVDPPGGPEAEEPATDVCAVFLGFGIFVANSAFSFRQFQDGNMQGWSSQRQGYLGERTIAYALGIFLCLRGDEARPARRHLDTNPRSYLRHAMRDLLRRRQANLGQLRKRVGRGRRGAGAVG